MSRVLTPLFAVLFGVAWIAVAWTLASTEVVGSASTSPYVTRADFDQAFADAGERGDSKAITRDEIERRARSLNGAAPNVNRDQKGDRLPALGETDAAASPPTSNTVVVRKNAASPELASGTSARQNAFDNAIPLARPIPMQHCEPVASPFADPVLGRIIGRCFV
jgi:hypothetical protein